MDFGDLTCVEVFRALNEGDYVYDSVEEHLRRIMSDEKRNAVLPVRTYDDIVHVSSNTTMATAIHMVCPEEKEEPKEESIVADVAS
ncbi:unnamed protein product [Nippostrongylus brasiliensis]|uniref:CBS domain-containing protein n=1 Tax=Nippostrongylus brasiliensis TaxID=27835 RepID=A0A0N4XYN3_NIPBR|nr:unnamed protein product [Nippostrongylus brasiliensis]